MNPTDAHAGDAARLEEIIEDCAALDVARRILLVQVPRQFGRTLRPGFRRLLAEQIEPFTLADRARLFRPAGEHLAVLWRGDAPGLELAAAHLRELLAGPETEADCVRLFILPRDAALVRHVLAGWAAEAAPNAVPAPAGPRRLALPELARIEAALAQADLTRFMRRRNIHRPEAGGLALHWEHRLPDLAELAESLAPGTDLAADPWLRHRLGRALERRVLALLSDPRELRGARPFLLDLSPSGWAEPGFVRFDDALPRALRGAIAIRLDAADLVLDPPLFARARDDLRARGYRLVLTLGTAALLAAFPPELTGVDLVELPWPATGAVLSRVLLGGIPDARAAHEAVVRGAALLAGPGTDS